MPEHDETAAPEVEEREATEEEAAEAAEWVEKLRAQCKERPSKADRWGVEDKKVDEAEAEAK